VKSAEKEPLLFEGYARSAFFFCGQHTWPRSFCLRMIASPWFERISLFVIMINFITLGMYRPCEDIVCSSTRCYALQYLDHIIFAFFAIEMLIKITAMGLIGKRKYLADSWNCLDLFIVATGLVSSFLFVETRFGLDFEPDWRLFHTNQI
jgi:hypothetical protein